MGTKTIQIKTIGGTLALIVLIEAIAGIIARSTQWSSIAIIGVARIIQIAGMLIIVIRQEGGLDAVGAARTSWISGLQQGALWSAGFALTAGAGIGIGLLFGYNPLVWIKAPLPREWPSLMTFLMVGGLIAPLAEELCFRGILFTYFRKWGFLSALLISTGIFVGLHSMHGFPFTQIIGGLVFALAFEISGNLLVPVTIHISGNLAIFALSLPLISV